MLWSTFGFSLGNFEPGSDAKTRLWLSFEVFHSVQVDVSPELAWEKPPNVGCSQLVI